MVIGGSGFFGKSILDSYRRGKLRKWGVTNIYILSRNAELLKRTNPELINGSVVLMNGDITRCDSIPAADYVIHAAASSNASKYIEAPEIERNNIVSGVENFCCLMEKSSRDTKILYVSSGAVYGSSSPDCIPFTEQTAFMPLNRVSENKQHYVAAKRESEERILRLGKSGLNVAVARCFTFIGKYLPRDRHFAIGNFIQDGLDNKNIEIKAKQRVYRSYMYADDLVEWLMTICKNANDSCPVFNVGSDEVSEIRDLANLVANFYNVSVNGGQITENKVDFYVPAVDKAKKELGLKLMYSAIDSIKLTKELLREP